MKTTEKAIELIKKYSALKYNMYCLKHEYRDFYQPLELTEQLVQTKKRIMKLFGLVYKSKWQIENPNEAIAIVEKYHTQPRKAVRLLVTMSNLHFSEQVQAANIIPELIEWLNRSLPVERSFNIYEYFVCHLYNTKKISYCQLLRCIEKALPYANIIKDSYEESDVLFAELKKERIPYFNEFVDFLNNDKLLDEYIDVAAAAGLL